MINISKGSQQNNYNQWKTISPAFQGENLSTNRFHSPTHKTNLRQPSS